MKHLAFLILFLSVLTATTACTTQTRQDEVPDTLGKYERKQIWTHGEVQDYTDFGTYTYASVSFDKNPYFTKVSSADTDTICAFIEDFEKWVGNIGDNDPHNELVVNYSFDHTIIDNTDYFYIYEDTFYPALGSYDVWFFDSQTNVLYYFHNNI